MNRAMMSFVCDHFSFYMNTFADLRILKLPQVLYCTALHIYVRGNLYYHFMMFNMKRVAILTFFV